jgi:BON domain
MALCVAVGCRTGVNPRLIEDAQTTVRIRTALVNDPELGLRSIDVHVRAGVARLTGSVGSNEEAQRLVSLVRAIAGVQAVQSDVQVGERSAPDSPPAGQRPDIRSEVPEGPSDPRLIAVGGAVSWTIPFVNELTGATSGGPLVRFGSGSGFAPAIDFNWFVVDVFAGRDPSTRLAAMSVKPVMGGVAYRWAGERLSVSLSVVAGYSFNRLVTDDLATGKLLALQVDSSFAWRPGVTIWYDATTRLAFNVFAGYVVTRPTVTFFEDGRIEKRDQRADTLLVSTGVAYKLF